MFKKSMLVLLVLFIASFCYAQTNDKPAEQVPANEQAQPVEQAQDTSTEQPKQIIGTIHKIDHKKMMFTLKDETTKEKKEYTFTDQTTFMKDDATITHNDLKKGDRVSVELDSKDTILKISLLPKESAETEKKSEKPE
jgi:hypothetical protein